jgi:hypothetical protein
MVTNIARLAATEELMFSTRLAKNNLSSCSEKIIKESPIAIAKIIEMYRSLGRKFSCFSTNDRYIKYSHKDQN